MLKKILLVLAVILVMLVLVGLVLPQDYRCTRSIEIAAQPARIHEFVGDLKRWDEWTPWKKHDPSAVTTLGEKSTGIGASQTWTSDGGDGRLTFTKSDPATGIQYDLVFDHANETPSRGWIVYEPSGTATRVEWGMEGALEFPVIGGYFALMADSMMGPMFQEGLDELKRRAESQ